jgi:hypothetical protein
VPVWKNQPAPKTFAGSGSNDGKEIASRKIEGRKMKTAAGEIALRAAAWMG